MAIPNQGPPIFLTDQKVREILNEVRTAIPPHAKLYLYGGSLRNALYYSIFKMPFPQRDFDLIFMGDIKQFVQNLRARKFTYGKTRKSYKLTMKKKKVAAPQGFGDYVYLDILFRTPAPFNIEAVLKHRANFTVNGIAIPFSAIFSPGWRSALILLPDAIQDLKTKQLRINTCHSDTLFACLRFMSQGFKAPTLPEVEVMLEGLRLIRKRWYDRNIKKTIDYCGGRRKVKALLAQLGVKINIFDFAAVHRKILGGPKG